MWIKSAFDWSPNPDIIHTIPGFPIVSFFGIDQISSSVNQNSFARMGTWVGIEII